LLKSNNSTHRNKSIGWKINEKLLNFDKADHQYNQLQKYKTKLDWKLSVIKRFKWQVKLHIYNNSILDIIQKLHSV
jgi:hypothetical protein